MILVTERAYAGVIGSVKGKHIDSVSGRVEKLVLKPVAEMLRKTERVTALHPLRKGFTQFSVWSPTRKRRTGLLRDRNVGLMSRFKAFNRLPLSHRSVSNKGDELRRIDGR